MKDFKSFLKEDNKIGFGDYALFDNDNKSNFWGNSGSGVLPICKKTGKILVGLRSKYVNEPNTWNGFGGKIDNEEDPKCAAKREFEEETKYHGNIQMVNAFVFKTKGFVYYNYIGLISNEFKPENSWETESTKWITFDELMKLKDKHYGLESLLKDPETLNLIKKYSK